VIVDKSTVAGKTRYTTIYKDLPMKIRIALLSLPLVCVSFLPIFAQVATETETGSAKKDDGAAVSKMEEAKAPLKFAVADGNLMFETTGDWQSVKPKSRMLEFEIKVPKVEGDETDGRLTVMGAGGSIAANIQRWEGQFSQADGSATKAKTEELTIDQMKITMVDVEGAFTQTMGGPFSGGKKVKLEDQRMLSAIIQTPKNGNYFIKLVGPAATIKANEDEFKKMIKGVQLKASE